MTENKPGNTLALIGKQPGNFQDCFQRHLRAGTRPGVPPDRPAIRWTPATFQPALAAALKTQGDQSPPTRRAVSNWFTQGPLPRERFIEPILDVLFGGEAGQAPERVELLYLWQAARAAGQAVEADAEDEAPAQPPAFERWSVTSSNTGPGLADLRIQMPPDGNDPNTFLLQVTLSLARWPDEIEGLCVQFGLRNVHLAPVWTHCQPSGLPKLDHVEERGGVFHVTGPRPEPDSLLEGRPLEGTTLATMERTSAAPAAVTLVLRGRRHDLEVVAEDDISTNKEAILRLFLQECQIEDETRFVTWGTATLTEKPAP